jgi:hypothetical protein
VLYDRLVLTRSKVAATRTPHAKEAASRQLDAYQDQLDAAVFTLFGATQEDRDTIETVLESVDR